MLTPDPGTALTVEPAILDAQLAQLSALGAERDALAEHNEDLEREVSRLTGLLEAVTAAGTAYAAELKDALDLVAAMTSPTATHRQREAQLRADLQAARQEGQHAATIAAALYRSVTLHGACPGVRPGEYALEGTEHTCPQCEVTWLATGLDLADVQIDDDGTLAAQTRTSWVVAPTVTQQP